MYRIRHALVLTLLLTLAQAFVWRALNPERTAPDVAAQVEGFAFSGYTRWQQPPSDETLLLHQKNLMHGQTAQLARDLQQVAQFTQHIRTYSTLEWPQLPALADQHKLRLTLGAWLSPNPARNRQELQSVIAAAQQHASVEALVIGNETLLQKRVMLAELVTALDTVRKAVSQPVSTAEPWHVWLDNPTLADHVDFITIHLLPYWEGVAVDDAVNNVFQRYAQVQQRFPGKRIVIGETGWPSNGPDRGRAVASPNTQAVFIRQFLARASQTFEPHASSTLPNYFLMEAIDQPWKTSIEGQAGAYWGFLDADRQPKLQFSGPLHAHALWHWQAALACLIAALLCGVLLSKLTHLKRRAQLLLALVLQGMGAGAALLLTEGLEHYLSATALTVWLLMLAPTGLMMLVMISQTLEFADTFWDGQLRHAAKPLPWVAKTAGLQPLVSIHVACSNEPPQMVIETLESLLNLHWNNLQIIIIDNNTRNPDCWTPVRDHIAALATAGLNSASAAASRVVTASEDRFQLDVNVPGRHIIFRHERALAGYKAGALNLALELTHADAQWTGVVDADYVVAPDWIESVGGHFNTADVDIIQSPQTHRMTRGSVLERMMCAEYDTFFRIGMHHRHERNAIIQHGTMTLIRTGTLRRLGGWNADCICEDTELGLRILATGARALYIDQPLGAGLLPANAHAYKRQRLRWACGAMQILRSHWRLLAGEKSSGHKLTHSQRYHFIAGWLPWWGDTLHLFMTVAALAWTAGMLLAPSQFGAPAPLFMVAPVSLLAFRLLLGPLLYRQRVGTGLTQWGGAALAGMALSHTIARGILKGLFEKHTAFEVTAKSASPAAITAALSSANPTASESIGTNGAAERYGATGTTRITGTPAGTQSLFTTPRETRIAALPAEGLMLLAFTCASALLIWRPLPPGSDAASQTAWVLMLGLQSLPYAAAVVLDYFSFRAKAPAKATTQASPKT